MISKSYIAIRAGLLASGAIMAMCGPAMADSNASIPIINNGTTITLPDQHTGETAQTQALSITNIGQQTDSLNASVDSTSGGAFATGSISNLFGGLTDNTSLGVGVSTSSAGAISGGVTVAFTGGQVLSNSLAYGTPTGGSLGSQNLTVQGGVYNYAALGIANIGTVGTLTGLSFVVNAVVGTGISTANLAIENVAPANGFSESLLVSPAYPSSRPRS